MAHAHNVIIRGLNAIIRQAPYVSVGNTKDVKDLLFFVQSWAKMVNHHHWVEESFIFPELEKSTGKAGIMQGPKHQHGLFHDGVEKLLAYTEYTSTKPESYSWAADGGMKEIIDSFSQYLVDHLYAEIDVFLGLGNDSDIDGAMLKETWAKAEKIAQQNGNLAMLVRPP
jgi:hemerythrin-like domain-containing protein